MTARAFSTTPPMVWDDATPKSILHTLDHLVARASASDSSFNRGEWLKVWKAVGEVMGNSYPVLICDPEQSAGEYLHSLIIALGGSIATPQPRLVYLLNGTNQYLDIIDDLKNDDFLFATRFYFTNGGGEKFISSHPVSSTYIKITVTGDLEIQIDSDPLITIPSATVGDITKIKRLEVGRHSRSVRVRIDGVTVYTLADHGNGKFGAQYLGTNATKTTFSAGAFFDVQMVNKHGEHFYVMDDNTQTLVDSGENPFDGQIINYDQSGWVMTS